MKTKTELALLARGFDAATARNIALMGYSFGRLQKETDESLNTLGVKDDLISKLRGGKRPPIPQKTLQNLLYKSARTCCICRDKTQPIIIHHIIEWVVSRSHEIENLVVLCLNCHAKAHSKSTISLNLTSEQVAKAKVEWEKTVKEKEANAIFSKSSWNLLNGVWDYFNHNRIISTIHQLGLDPAKVKGYDVLYNLGHINADGSYVWPPSPAPQKKDLRFMYEGGQSSATNLRLDFYANLVREILKVTNFVDITETFKKSAATNFLHINDIVCVTGGHRFKCTHNLEMTGPGQMRVGYRQANGLLLNFNFDGWETTSPSSHSVNLRGLWRCTSISIVRSITVGNKTNTVNCTCLAIGTGFTEYVGKTPTIALDNEFDNDWSDTTQEDSVLESGNSERDTQQDQ